MKKSRNEEPVIINKEEEMAIVYNREQGRMTLVTPSLDGGACKPEEIALIGVFHRLGSDKAFLKEAYNYIANDPELLQAFGLVANDKSIQ